MNNEYAGIPGYEDLYKISRDCGAVYSIKRSRLMSQKFDKDGYREVSLTKNGIAKTFKIHRLVMMTFVGSSELEVDHIDGNRSNNRLENLEYVTHAENIRRSRRMQSSSAKYPIGVSFNKQKDLYQARITIDGKRKSLGYYKTAYEAGEAYTSALESTK